MVSIITILRGITDPRTGNVTRHDLLEVLTIALVASICGCKSCVDLADLAEEREELFREVLILENGRPSHDTSSRLFRLLNPAVPSSCFSHFLDRLAENGPGVIAILRPPPTSSNSRDPRSPYGANESAPTGPTLSPERSSVKCESPGASRRMIVSRDVV